MRKKVIIIGAGVGGLATAIRLLSKGYDVKIYEKEDSVGGKANQLKANGFSFDLTASILMSPEIYKEIFTIADRDYRDYIEFNKVDPIYRAIFSDGNTYDFSCDIVELVKTLSSISTHDTHGYLRFISDVFEKYLVADEYFLEKTYRSLNDFFNPVSLIKALKLKTLSTPYDLISKYVENEKLRQFICFQSLYVGISPYNGPSIYTLVPAISQMYGLWQLIGGMYSYILALEKLMNELGGSIETDTNVDEIMFSGNSASGIKSNKGIEKADIVICNADFPYALKELVKDEKAKGKYTDEKLEEMKYSCSTFIIYFGLKKKYPQLQTHNLYIGEDFKENIEAAFKGYLPEKPSFYIYCPSRLDKDMAPAKKECISVTIRVPNLLSSNISWDDNTICLLREGVVNELCKIKGLEDFEENIEYESYLTPEDLLNRFNSYGGAAFGLSPSLMQTNYFRPHIKSPTVKNLYFVGSSVHPGPGVSIVLLSSRLVVEEILRDEKKK